jgi:hypothetical protein
MNQRQGKNHFQVIVFSSYINGAASAAEIFLHPVILYEWNIHFRQMPMACRKFLTFDFFRLS